ncbi:MAG: oligosaccharide flippase family protein [Candidatus Omnitrophica bacterium]|nr:oligosaccharide flippase family protein [Candidatus Omnitrophota bacterium]
MNSYSQILQIVVVSAIYFFLYRFLLNSIGAELFGIWSLIIAFANVPSIINLGMSGSTIKYVAKYIALNDKEKILSVIQTAIISIILLFGCFILIIYPIIKKILYSVIPRELIDVAFYLLPFGLISFFLRYISGIFQSALDGFQRFYLRNAVWIVSATINLILCILLVPIYGVKGAAYSFLIQNTIMILGNYIFLKKVLPELRIFLFKWDIVTFKEMFNYGGNLQLNSFAYIFIDPILKFLLGKFGGISIIAYFEMANKIIGQLKMLIISVIQTLVPIISQLKEKMPEKINEIYIKCCNITSYLSMIMFFLFMIYSPIISRIWIGRYENNFVAFSTLLCFHSFIWNITYCAEAICLGTGKLKWILIANIKIVLLSIFLGYLLGTFYDGFGIIIAYTIASIVGSVIKYISFHLMQKIEIDFILKDNMFNFSLFVLGVIFNLIAVYFQRNYQIITRFFIIYSIIFSILMIAYIFIINKKRKEIYILIKNQFLIPLKIK